MLPAMEHRLCCGNEGEAGYTLIIDGNTIADEGNNNFGSEEVLEFCGGGGGGGSGGGGHGKCAAGELDVAFTFTTDDYG